MRGTTVVFGGGGIWGVAWMTGLAMGLADHGIDLSQADGFIGTSAGSVVGSQMAAGLKIADLFARQTVPAKQPREPLAPPEGMARLMALVNRTWADEGERVRAIADLALQSKTITVAQRRADIMERLGIPDTWPPKPLQITAVDTATCELTVFTAAGGAGLIDAVASSCAVPGAWPPIPVQGRVYMDGGLWRTGENAHLAAGKRSILVVSPFGARAAAGTGLHADIAALERSGSKVALIGSDDAALATVGQKGPMDPSVRAAAAEAGRAQAAREVEKVRKFLA